MRIVIDTNVLMAGLLKDSSVREVLLFSEHEFFLPEFSLEEIRKYEEEIIRKSGYSREELKLMINHLLWKVRIVFGKIIRPYMKTAEDIMRGIDIKDSSFIATALAINAEGIWSFDRDFKKQKKIRIFEIKDLFD